VWEIGPYTRNRCFRPTDVRLTHNIWEFVGLLSKKLNSLSDSRWLSAVFLNSRWLSFLFGLTRSGEVLEITQLYLSSESSSGGAPFVQRSFFFLLQHTEKKRAYLQNNYLHCLRNLMYNYLHSLQYIMLHYNYLNSLHYLHYLRDNYLHSLQYIILHYITVAYILYTSNNTRYIHYLQ